MQICRGKMKAKKSLKNWIWEGLGLHLGGLWEGLGPLLGALGRFLAVLWAFKNQLFLQALVQDRLQEAFWIDFGHFGRVLGGF